MEQMNKKELIEYFIEQLGNNEILGKVMSIKNYPGYQEIKEENCGIHLTESRYFTDGSKMESNRNYAINEGMTDTLAERITGNFHNGYNTEKDIYEIVAIIVGEDNMLKKYFSEHVYE